MPINSNTKLKGLLGSEDPCNGMCQNNSIRVCLTVQIYMSSFQLYFKSTDVLQKESCYSHCTVFVFVTYLFLCIFCV